MIFRFKHPTWRVFLIVSIYFALFGVLDNLPTMSRFEAVRERITNRLFTPHGSPRLRDRWTIYAIEMTASALVDAEQQTSQPVNKLLALIEYESGWSFWTCDQNYRGRKYHSEDCGLTRQNSRHWQRRCKIALGRKCQRGELWIPWLSVRLMVERFRECKEFWNSDLVFLCYNSNQRAMEGHGTYLDVWRTHLKRWPPF